jgi:hypothetical protein
MADAIVVTLRTILQHSQKVGALLREYEARAPNQQTQDAIHELLVKAAEIVESVEAELGP